MQEHPTLLPYINLNTHTNSVFSYFGLSVHHSFFFSVETEDPHINCVTCYPNFRGPQVRLWLSSWIIWIWIKPASKTTSALIFGMFSVRHDIPACAEDQKEVHGLYETSLHSFDELLLNTGGWLSLAVWCIPNHMHAPWISHRLISGSTWTNMECVPLRTVRVCDCVIWLH